MPNDEEEQDRMDLVRHYLYDSLVNIRVRTLTLLSDTSYVCEAMHYC